MPIGRFAASSSIDHRRRSCANLRRGLAVPADGRKVIHVKLRQWHLGLLSGLFCAAGLVSLPSPAHHSYAAYDLNLTRTLKGTVESFHWSNPHSTFTLVLEPDGRGEPIKWNIITSGPAILKRFGWTQDSLKPGDRVSVLCNPMTDGSHGGRLHTVVLLDTGQVLRTKFSDGPQ
jgi:Family of unknown function (DUF6152)